MKIIAVKKYAGSKIEFLNHLKKSEFFLVRDFFDLVVINSMEAHTL